ncbi:universal stress protein [Nocardioides sp. AE5]|uniref:universal stress protein n=1 Tax=Nocardioides sp. AE5 TaxID=2962573 RepID=UPI002881AB57|nr:universal stress protein [Nocardioides sp. AE5]MDT0202000.1 universal stress protein [Nocardioides sp. AE5]
MHVVIATDGSRQSLTAARKFKAFADPKKVTEISIVAVIRPLAAVAFANDLSPSTKPQKREDNSSRKAAADAVDALAAVFDDWEGPVHKRIRSGSAANEIIKAAKQYDAGLVVIAAGGRGLSDTVLMGSTAQRVQHYAPCPVLVVRPTKTKKAPAKKAAAKKAATKKTAQKPAAKKATAKKPVAKKTATKKAAARK